MVGEGRFLPGTLPISPPLSKVARVWAYRKRVEHEAADQFERLAAGLSELGADTKLIRLAKLSAEDEKRHAILCRKIIDQTDAQVIGKAPQLGMSLGPEHWELRQRILYACVSLSCVTETLSTALLIEMKKQAGPLTVRETVHSILEDEITHSRIGWAQLATEANYCDVSWLSPFIPGMIRDAIMAEPLPRVVQGAESLNDNEWLSEWGILPEAKATAIMLSAINGVVLPGLKAFGINPPSNPPI